MNFGYNHIPVELLKKLFDDIELNMFYGEINKLATLYLERNNVRSLSGIKGKKSLEKFVIFGGKFRVGFRSLILLLNRSINSCKSVAQLKHMNIHYNSSLCLVFLTSWPIRP